MATGSTVRVNSRQFFITAFDQVWDKKFLLFFNIVTNFVSGLHHKL